MEIKLNNTFYAGNQMWSSNKAIHDYGCGVVAAFDSFNYLYNKKAGSNIYSDLSSKTYIKTVESFAKKYFSYSFGINGLALASGMNKIFRNYELPYSAKWVSSKDKLFERIKGMLSNDIPVIFSIGPNFPLFWKKHELIFYQKNDNDNLVPIERVTDHYATIIAIDDNWLTVSSWGLEYLIRISEYKYYVENYSNYLFSNVILITLV